MRKPIAKRTQKRTAKRKRRRRNHRAAVHRYIDGVLSGRIVAGELVRLACARHKADLKHARKRGFYFSEPHANEAIDFIETCCRHSVGKFAGQPFKLSPWQRFIVWCLFGWRQIEDGMRRFRRALIEIARKNAWSERNGSSVSTKSLI